MDPLKCPVIYLPKLYSFLSANMLHRSVMGPRPDCHPELSLGCHLLLLADCFQAVVGIVPQPVAVFQAVFLG